MTVHITNETASGAGFVIVWRHSDKPGADLIDVLQACAAQEYSRRGDTYTYSHIQSAIGELDQRYADQTVLQLEES